jgi:hypothetical protein|tara:strand:+ start:8339 stop:8785 length:447 start_codon:yes stop_codon:yes gene_type:complete
MSDKKIKDTALGAWLSTKVPELAAKVGDLLPNSGALGIVKNLLDGEPSVSAEDRLEFERLKVEQEIEAQKAVSDRWKSDMNSDVKLAKFIRPVTLIALMTMFILTMVADSVDGWPFNVKDVYVDLLQILMLTAFGAYFAGRTIEKTKR